MTTKNSAVQACLAVAAAVLFLPAAPLSAQFLAEQAAVAGIQGELSSQQMAGGQVALDRARAVANPNPNNPGLAGLGGPAVAPQGQVRLDGQPGQAATPTPVPLIQVLTGDRVFDAVTGALLEDARKATVFITEQAAYFDDGVQDNGIPNDGIMGNVRIERDKRIGAETAAAMFQAINLVRNAERMTVLEFFRLRVGLTDPSLANRFLSAENGQMPDLLALERKKDEFLRDWNNRFLAVYRTNKNDPKSDFYQVYVPEPPAIPQYPMPAGYNSPQRMEAGLPAPAGQQAAQPGAPAEPRRTPNIHNGESHFGDWTQARPIDQDGK